VPSDGVVDTGDVQYVFVVRGAGKFEPRQVKVGTRGDDLTEITDGVAEGDVVVTTANFLIDSESRLRAAVEGQTARAPEAATAPGEGPSCEKSFDKAKYPDKYQACRACEVQHRGMGTMEEDCKKAIAKPWR
jgi:membrane fusion protein, copper/silver efflux system